MLTIIRIQVTKSHKSVKYCGFGSSLIRIPELLSPGTTFFHKKGTLSLLVGIFKVVKYPVDKIDTGTYVPGPSFEGISLVLLCQIRIFYLSLYSR